jgi:hypothetical protein
MTIRPIRREERDPRRINEAIEQLMQGRSNAHGSFALTDDGVATSTVVTAPTCASASDVNITPTNANAANAIRTTDLYVVAGNGSFTVHHAASALSRTFTYSING